MSDIFIFEFTALRYDSLNVFLKYGVQLGNYLA